MLAGARSAVLMPRRPGLIFPASGVLAGATLTRASQAARTNASRLLELVANDTVRAEHDPLTGAYLGWLIEPARTNGSRSSQAFGGSGWTRRGTFTATDNSIAAPDGTTTGSLIAGVDFSPAGDMFETAFSLTARFANSTALAWSFWIRRVSASGILSVSSGLGGAFGSASVNLALLTAGLWTRVYTGHPAVTTTTAFTSSATGANGLLFSCNTGAPISFYMWGDQLEAGAAYSSYIPTTTVSATRAADALVLSAAAFGLADGSYTMQYLFDDYSVQNVSTTIAGGTWTVPTTLNRPILRSVTRL